MSFRAPSKLKTFKNDLAPFGLYFDIFTTDIFEIPIIPVPLRIDKMSNGQSTLFILPYVSQLNRLLYILNLNVNYFNFFSSGLSNLVKYTKKKYNEITYRDLNEEKLKIWLEKSKNLRVEIPTFRTDFTYIITHFLLLYSKLLKKDFRMSSESIKKNFKKYFRKVLKYLEKRIKKNEFMIIDDNEVLKSKKIFKKRGGKLFPDSIKIKFYSNEKKKKVTMKLLPYLIYGDLYDVFSYNLQLINDTDKSTINRVLTAYKDNKIINKGSNIYEFSIREIELDNIL